MKNLAQERFRVQMRQYHQSHPWRLVGGLYVPHAYPEPHQTLSWWGDIGFILNGRRIMVWWVHPRMKYEDKMRSLAWQEAGEPPLSGDDMFGPTEKQFRKIGRSRKKLVAYRTEGPPDVMRDYYDRHDEIESRIKAEGIDYEVRPSMTIQRLSWCMGIELCLPVEVRNLGEIEKLAAEARRLVKRETTLNNEFPEYRYGKQDWLAETEARNLDRANRCQAEE